MSNYTPNPFMTQLAHLTPLASPYMTEKIFWRYLWVRRVAGGWVAGQWVWLNWVWVWYGWWLNFISALSFFVSMVELAWGRKKKWRLFFKSQQGVYCWVVVLGLGWWWVDEKERKIEWGRIEMKREERKEKRERDLFILFYSVIYIILIYHR